MSFDRTEGEYHLTLSGWKTGSFLIYGKGDKNPPPDDHIETWIVEKYQSSGFADEQVAKKLSWTSPDFPGDEREALKEKYPFLTIHALKQEYRRIRKRPQY